MSTHTSIAAISLLVLASVTTASGINYNPGDATASRDVMSTSRRSDATAQIREVGAGEEQRPRLETAVNSQGVPLPNVRRGSDRSDTIREKKTLAVLLLMLRDGRGAR